ncbi:NAD(P)/FAD-dependent oxidoreductase [Acuticoccus kandeliae]|uniref:NAD(P)/FAD-dependent oxidoreductase n=1 Tax=Acuticoccus kandeliae TaxID=2073160 RepID=UPI000D3E3849|nr:FAD-dependent oxidoreductase [Acuticoccus kandeliae]
MKVDVAIVGGGITGCATAYELAGGGASVVVLERGEIAALASAANAGSLHAQIPFDPFLQKGEGWARDYAPVTRVMSAAVDAWKDVEAALGVSLEVKVGGGILVAASDEAMRNAERKARLEAEAGLAVEVWSAADLRREAPYLAPDHVGGVFCPNEGKANPLLAGRAFASAATRRGAVIRRGTEVAALERSGGAWRVHLADGSDVEADMVVNAAGTLAAAVAALAGVHIAAEGYPIQSCVTERATQTVPHLVYATREKLTLKQTATGSMIIGGGWPSRQVGNAPPTVDPRNMLRNLEVATATMPSLGRLRVVRSWAAIVNGTEDWMPVIGEAATAPGFFNAYFPWMGFTASPIVAKTIAAAVLQRRADTALGELAGL